MFPSHSDTGFDDSVDTPELHINSSKFHRQMKQAQQFGLVFEITITVPDKAAAAASPVFASFNEQILKAAYEKCISWGEPPEGVDTSEYEQYHWTLLQGGNESKVGNRFQKLNTKTVPRPHFTLETLRKIAKSPANPLAQTLLLIIGKQSLYIYYYSAEACLAPQHAYLSTTVVRSERGVLFGKHYCLMERALSGYMTTLPGEVCAPEAVRCRSSCESAPPIEDDEHGAGVSRLCLVFQFIKQSPASVFLSISISAAGDRGPSVHFSAVGNC